MASCLERNFGIRTLVGFHAEESVGSKGGRGMGVGRMLGLVLGVWVVVNVVGL